MGLNSRRSTYKCGFGKLSDVFEHQFSHLQNRGDNINKYQCGHEYYSVWYLAQEREETVFYCLTKQDDRKLTEIRQ